jgi:hypothetical protein
VVQIVDGVGGAVLLDLNSGSVLLGQRSNVKLGDVDLGKIDRPVQWTSQTSTAAPDDLVSRQITAPIVAVCASPDAAAAFVASLHRLVQSPFVLKIQRHGGTVPVWLRCWPSAPRFDTQVAGAGVPTNVVIGTLQADTEPYAIGARVDVAAATVTQDPTSAGAFTLDVNGVTGDSLTPAVLRFSTDVVSNVVDQMMVAVRRRGTPSAIATTSLVVQAESGSSAVIAGGTPAPTLSTFTGDATFSGASGGGGVRATFPSGALNGSPGFAVTVTPSLSGVEAPGQYHVLARVRRSGGAAGQPLLLWTSVGPAVLRESYVSGGADTRVVDLGIVQVPIGQPPFMAAPEGPRTAISAAIKLQVYKQWAGAGVVDVDWIGLVPADQDCGMLTVDSPAPGTGLTVVVDGYDAGTRIYSADPYGGGSPVAQGATAVSWIGGPPRLRPGNNRLWLITGLGAGVVRAPSVSFPTAVSYWPRYRWLG